MANIIHGVNFKYIDDEGKEQHRSFGYYSMCLGGLQGNIPANMAIDMNEAIADDNYMEAGYEDEYDYCCAVSSGDEEEPEGWINPIPYSMHVWPMCFPNRRNKPGPDFMTPLGKRWKETIEYSPELGIGSLDYVSVEEYIKFLRFFCYRTRFSVFFVNLPKPSKLTAKWIAKNGIELAFDKGSERDWSYAYTTVRAVTKINRGNFRLWCALQSDYTTDLQKLVLWHALQQGSWHGDCWENEADSCHCISNVYSLFRKGFAYRVMYPDASASATLADLGKVQSAKTQYFMQCAERTDCPDRRVLRLYDNRNISDFRINMHQLVKDEVAHNSKMRASNKFNDK